MEHPITEEVIGVDLVKEQIKVADGQVLQLKQENIQQRGHAIECRINAEDPERGFMPCPGTIENMHLPGGNGVRVETALYQGYTIPPMYDSMVAKLIVHDRNRRNAIRKMQSALGEMVIEGVTTNIDFQFEILNDPDFQNGNVNTHFIQEHYGE